MRNSQPSSETQLIILSDEGACRDVRLARVLLMNLRRIMV